MDHALFSAVRDRQAILFVGAGVSMNLGLPSWDELVTEMGRRLKYDSEVFEGLGIKTELAQFYEIRKRSFDTLRKWMNRKWHTSHKRVDRSRVHRAIVNLQFPIIYTTNFDRWLEIAYERRNKRFTKVSNVSDFARIRDGVTQIIKFHGDLDDVSPLVLTETDYFDRLVFESPLDIKLRSDSIGKTILFIGYGMSDINLRYLLYKLERMWTLSRFADERPRSFIFLTRPNSVQETILQQRGIQPIVSKKDDPADGLTTFLEGLVKAVSMSKTTSRRN